MKTQVPWSTDEIDVLRANSSKDDCELACLLPRHTLCAIGAKRRRLGLLRDSTFCSQKACRNRALLDPDLLCKVDQSLTLDQLEKTENATWQVLIGSLLGDGGLKRNTGGRNRFQARNYYFATAHCEYQRPYVEWKRQMLLIFHPSQVAVYRPELITCSHALFTKLRPLFYSPSAKRRTDLIPELAFQGLDLLGLLVWFLDDGSCGFGPGVDQQGRGVTLSIAAMSYGPSQLGRMADVLNSRFSLHLYVRESHWKVGRMNYHLKIPYEDWFLLIPAWRQLFVQYQIPLCMEYKLIPNRSI